MEKEFIPYEQALALKELGFDEICLGYYTIYNFKEKKSKSKLILNECVIDYNDVNQVNRFLYAPLYQQSFRWFREKHKLYNRIQQVFKEEKLLWFEFVILTNKTKSTLIPGIHSYIVSLEKNYNIYEEAELECLKKLIEIVKDNK